VNTNTSNSYVSSNEIDGHMFRPTLITTFIAHWGMKLRYLGIQRNRYVWWIYSRDWLLFYYCYN
jgi:hypothetical protein